MVTFPPAHTAGALAPEANSRTTDYGDGHLMAADPAGGYWLTNSVGQVLPHGGALYFGGVSGPLNQTIVSMATARDGLGYWLVAGDGGVFSYGDARFFGSTGSIHLNRPIVGMGSTPDGAGYWLVAADGGIFTYGDAQFFGSTGSIHLNRPIVAMEPTPDGNGYWLVGSDGGLFNFGDAPYYGSLSNGTAEVVGIVVTPGAAGYDLVTAAGEAERFGPAANPASNAPTTTTSAPSTTTTAPPSPEAALMVPSTIADDCSSDVTRALNSWIQQLPSGAVVDLPPQACYSVSNTSTTLTLNEVNGLTINGDGAALRQSVYEGGACGNNEVQPVITLTSDTNITINDLTIDAPGNCGGAYNEGDYGILLGQATPGNTDITFNGVTVANTDGDGLAVYPQLGTCCGINTDITFENGAFTNVGYHTITPEGVNGLTISSNLFTNDGNFMDMEVDNSGYGNNFGTPTGNAQWNIAIKNNTFTDGSALSISSIQGTCIPQKNLLIEGNKLDATTQGIVIVLGGSGSSSCGQDSGLTIENNVSLGGAHSPCGGSVASPPACSMIEVADYKDVTISGNYFTANDGEPQYNYFDNTIYVPCITFMGVSTAQVQNNTCNNAWDIWDATQAQFTSSDYPNTAISDCGNTYWLTTRSVGPSSPLVRWSRTRPPA
jgi:hypothetical protein